jgi:hypothetical protein
MHDTSAGSSPGGKLIKVCGTQVFEPYPLFTIATLVKDGGAPPDPALLVSSFQARALNAHIAFQGFEIVKLSSQPHE